MALPFVVQTVCTYWLKGVCALGDKCGFLHEYNAERMPVCRNVVKFGVCKEPDCPYKHTLDDIKVSLFTEFLLTHSKCTVSGTWSHCLSLSWECA